MSVSVGQPAPDFTLPGTGDRTYQLSAYRGHPVVLVFYPADNSPVCTSQLNSYANDIDDFEGVDAQILAISPQKVSSHETFARRENFPFPLLADTDKSVGALYGVVGPLGFYRRSIVVVDRDGTVAYAHRSIAGVTFKPSDEILHAINGSAHEGSGHSKAAPNED